MLVLINNKMPEQENIVTIEPTTLYSTNPDTTELEVIAYQEPEDDPHRPGPKPKQLKALEVYGFEVGRGLRKRIVNPEDVYKLAALGCTDKEISIWFDIPYETLRYNFSDIMEKGRQEMKTSLRRAMLKNALNGNAALQIFLAKNWLGMQDSPTNSEEQQPLPWNSDE